LDESQEGFNICGSASQIIKHTSILDRSITNFANANYIPNTKLKQIAMSEIQVQTMALPAHIFK
jgi:hypothetical protein